MVTGIRGVFHSTGGVIGKAFIVLALELSPDKAAGMRMVFGILPMLLLTTVPLTFTLPDMARARRRSRLTPEPATATLERHA